MLRFPGSTAALWLALSVLGCASAPETPEPAGAARSAPSARIDEILVRQWQSSGVEPSALASDAEFLRRVSLDLIGRVPTHMEVDEFLKTEGPGKRAKLVDRLLDSDEFAIHWARHWANLLLPGDAKAEKAARDPLERFLADALAKRRAWDAVVRDLLASEGELRQRPELAFVAARAGRADKTERLAELTSTSSRVFLGSKIECAQCHDHPYDPTFSRDDFWSTVAWFGRLELDVDRDTRPPTIRVGERSRGELRVALTDGLEADQADARKRAIAPTFLGDVPAPSDLPRREQLAGWIVADPRFAAATVGIVWTRLFGRGIVEPWDDLLGLEEGEYPELLAELAAELRAHDHDLRALIRTIVLSQAYQRSSRAPGMTGEQRTRAETTFALATVRPLSAEQLFESLVVATGIDRLEDRAAARRVMQREREALREYDFVFADDEMASGDGFTGNVPQALLLLNGELTNQAVLGRDGSTVDRVLEQPDTDARIEALWRTVYARNPGSEERAWARTVVGNDPGSAELWEDLLFAMLQSTEFGSNH